MDKSCQGIRITSLIVGEADWPEKKSYSQIWIRMFALIQGHCIANWLIWSTCRGNIVQLLLMNQSTKIILIHIELSIPYFFQATVTLTNTQNANLNAYGNLLTPFKYNKFYKESRYVRIITLNTVTQPQQFVDID